MTLSELLSSTLASLLGRHTQATRLIRLHTPLGTDALFAEDVELWEGLAPLAGPALGDSNWSALDATPDTTGPWAFAAPLGPVRSGLRLVVHAFSDDAHLELKQLIGQPALLELLCQDSRTQLRPWHGHVVSAALVGSDGGLARYRLVIEPWLAALAHRVDSFVFQDMTVPQIIDAVFADYQGQGQLAPAWRWDLADASVYPRRSLCVQYQESDLDFVLRLLQEEGLFAWWTHSGAPGDATLGAHTLVLADHNAAFDAAVQPRVRFTGSDHTLGADSLNRWQPMRRVATASVALSSWDYRSLSTRPTQADVPGAAGAAVAELQINDVPGTYAYEDLAQGERLASRQAEALGALGTRVLAGGAWRRAQCGTHFTLCDHPRHSGLGGTADEFVVLAVQHRARNNLFADEKARLQSLSAAIAERAGLGDDTADAFSDAASARAKEPLHRAALLVQPLATAVRLAPAAPAWSIERAGFGRLGSLDAPVAPAHLFDPQAQWTLRQPDVRLNPRPTIHGTQTAIVVGAAPVLTDRDHRIKLQFHWQRGAQASHQLAHPAGDDNAPASEASSTWVRVGQNLAGANYGANFTPRVGQEVVVSFIGGDIDRPVVTGAVYNGQGQADAQGNQVGAGSAQSTGDAPAWFPGAARAGELQGHQHTAVMLGHKSQALATTATGQGGYNQLVFDDSPESPRIELSSTQSATRLQLGHLLHQQDNQRLDPRGHGLDLATDGHGALRSGQGTLLSTHTQGPSTGGGQQLQARDAQMQLENGQALVHLLAESAQAHGAKLATEPQVKGAKRDQAAKQLPVEQSGFALQDSLAVISQREGSDDSEEDAQAIAGGDGSVPAWGRPDLLVAAPDGIGMSTPAQLVVSAGTNTTLSAGQDINTLAQSHHASVAKSGVVFFTYGKASQATKPNTETGIALHAASGSVQMSSNTGATRVAADKTVNVASTSANVLVSAPNHVLLTAAGAALDIQSGSITLKAPGSIQFKASQKVLTGGGSVNASVNLAKPGALQVCGFRVSSAAAGGDAFVLL